MDSQDIYLTAELANIKLADNELDELTSALNQMVEYFEKMNEVNIDGLEPTTHAFISKNRVRSDVRVQENISDDILEQAPDLEDRFICIPNVL